MADRLRHTDAVSEPNMGAVIGIPTVSATSRESSIRGVAGWLWWLGRPGGRILQVVAAVLQVVHDLKTISEPTDIPAAFPHSSSECSLSQGQGREARSRVQCLKPEEKTQSRQMYKTHRSLRRFEVLEGRTSIPVPTDARLLILLDPRAWRRLCDLLHGLEIKAGVSAMSGVGAWPAFSFALRTCLLP
ncbi:hypothetical protein BC629DRAFT_1721973 [Irpex lacteus]|nr:hypothetical protein BC629DRAFT_1721973 [Irpex lacteus]